MLAQTPSTTPFEFLVIGAIAGTLTILTVFTAASRAAINWFKRTIGRRRIDRRKLADLTCGVRTEFVETLLGPSAFRFERGPAQSDDDAPFEPVQWIEDIYVMKDAYVQTCSRLDGAVQTVSITTMNRWFRPRLAIPGAGKKGYFKFKLGQMTYSDLPADPISTEIVVGAHSLHYNELYWFGNPGYYQMFILGYNDVSNVGFPRLAQRNFFADNPAARTLEDLPESLRRVRSTLRPNTLTVVGPEAMWQQYGRPHGADSEVVRIFPSHEPIAKREMKRQRRLDEQDERRELVSKRWAALRARTRGGGST